MAGKGFTVKKEWDNPVAHAMPEGIRVPAEFPIGADAKAFRVAPATVLAPMAGVTDTVFRRFIRQASLFSGSELPSSELPSLAAVAGVSAFANSASSAADTASSAIEAAITNQQSGCGLLM